MSTFEERFWNKVDVGSWHDCWPWLGAGAPGYGTVRVNGRNSQAHRVAYELLVGPIPDGLVIDHVSTWGCTKHSCCNPLHLEPVTPGENNRRAVAAGAARRARRTHCPSGHPYDEANTRWNPRGAQVCRACHREHQRRYLERA